jgi:hypothetical protein
MFLSNATALFYGSHSVERVSFDLTFRLIKNRKEEGESWKIGVFLGLSACNRLVPFGIAIMTESNKEAYMEIFRTFFAGGRTGKSDDFGLRESHTCWDHRTAGQR